MLNKKLVNKLKYKALSTNELQEASRLKIPIKTYNELNKDSIFNVLNNPSKAVIILYLYQPSYGHWTLLLHKGNYIEYLDSYGDYPDQTLTQNSYKKNKELGQAKPLILESVMKGTNPKPIYYNNKQLQLYKNDSQTCGRYILLRWRHRNKTLSGFINYLEKQKKNLNLDTFDQTVSWLTRNVD